MPIPSSTQANQPPPQSPQRAEVRKRLTGPYLHSRGTSALRPQLLTKTKFSQILGMDG